MMNDNVKEFFEKAKRNYSKMQSELPDTVSGFSGMFSKIMKDGSISAMQKELVAIGIAVAVQCEPCIRAHCQKCLAAGATREQILEAASVAVMMSGGPAYMYMSVVMETLDGLEE